MLYLSLALPLSFMNLVNDILTPVKIQVRHIGSLHNLPPKSSLEQALHKQRVIPLPYISSIPRVHHSLIWLCELKRNIDVVGEVDLEQKV